MSATLDRIRSLVASGEYRISSHGYGAHAETNKLRLEARNALYAVVRGQQVLYIGKTARTIRKRFVGYCRPVPGQRTNWRCNGTIREVLERGGEVRILVFTPIS